MSVGDHLGGGLERFSGGEGRVSGGGERAGPSHDSGHGGEDGSDRQGSGNRKGGGNSQGSEKSEGGAARDVSNEEDKGGRDSANAGRSDRGPVGEVATDERPPGEDSGEAPAKEVPAQEAPPTEGRSSARGRSPAGDITFRMELPLSGGVGGIFRFRFEQGEGFRVGQGAPSEPPSSGDLKERAPTPERGKPPTAAPDNPGIDPKQPDERPERGTGSPERPSPQARYGNPTAPGLSEPASTTSASQPDAYTSFSAGTAAAVAIWKMVVAAPAAVKEAREAYKVAVGLDAAALAAGEAGVEAGIAELSVVALGGLGVTLGLASVPVAILVTQMALPSVASRWGLGELPKKASEVVDAVTSRLGISATLGASFAGNSDPTAAGNVASDLENCAAGFDHKTWKHEGPEILSSVNSLVEKLEKRLEEKLERQPEPAQASPHKPEGGPGPERGD